MSVRANIVFLSGIRTGISKDSPLQFNFHLIWKPNSQIQKKGELMLSSRVISSWFNMDLSIMQLIPFLPAVTISKARQINDFSVPILVLIVDIDCL